MNVGKNRVVIFCLVTILLIGGFFRLYHLSAIPPGLFPDEAMNGTNAIAALHTAPPAGGFKLFYPENNGREGLFINLQAISVKFFGPFPWSLRLVSAIIGTLTILGIFLVAKELFEDKLQIPSTKIQTNPKPQAPKHKRFGNWNSGFRISNAEFIALLSAFFLAASYWHINFSRIGFRAIAVPLFSSFAIYWLLKSLGTGKISSAVLGGISAGLGFHTYIAFRFMPFVLAIPIVFALRAWTKRDANIQMHTNDTNSPSPPPYPLGAQHCTPCIIALFLFVTLVVALPMGLYFLAHPHDFFGRSSEVSIFSAQSPIRAFAISTVLTLGMFNIHGDCNPRQNYACRPELDWPVGIAFLIGIVLMVRAMFRRPYSLNPTPYILVGWFAIMMFPATLTREGLPHALRSIGLIPPVMILAGFGAWWLWGHAQAWFESFRRDTAIASSHLRIKRIQCELGIALVAVLAFVAGNTYQNYFWRFPNSPEIHGAFKTDITRMAEFARDATNARVYFVANYPDLRYGLPLETEVLKFITNTADPSSQLARNIHYLMPNDLDRIEVGGATRTIVIPMNQSDLAAIREIERRFRTLRLKAENEFVALSD